MINNNWNEKIAREIQEILSTYEPSQLNFKNNTRIKKTVLPTLNLLLIALISTIVCLIIYQLFVYIVIPAIFIAMIIVAEIYLIYYWKPHLIEQEILEKLDNQNYFQIAAKDILANKFSFISFNNEFSLQPKLFWPEDGVLTIDNVLNLKYKNAQVSFGTVTQTLKSHHVELDNKSRTLWNYHRYIFLTCSLKEKALDQPIFIKLADTHKKALKIVANETVGEEQFDLFFDVKSSNEQDFLSKNAKAQLINSLQHQQTRFTPIIAIDNEQITLCFQSKLLTGLYDNSFSLANFNLHANQNFIIEDICNKIAQDFNWFVDTFKWIESLDLI